MLLRRVWQTAYNRIFRIQKVIVRMSFQACNRTRVGKTRAGQIRAVRSFALFLK
jgi:hypothetical protein